SYPAPLEEANLAMIPDLAKRFDVLSGFSDHTLGITAPIMATTLGAKVIEKHFILDKSIGGPDSSFSLDKIEFKEMVHAIKATEKLLGRIDYSMNESKKMSRQFARSLYIAKDIKKGEKFTEENIKSVRPGYGKHPKFLKNILGKPANKNYTFGDRLI
ncbi:N-acetylneuraminate synthase family protein, partial [Sulfurimonas sp.]|uniref:N-acetylneuraminate synthase family protein n=1 Tax=Sulfurimonas sp. TaxID=2022749 RepID=UPI003D0BCD06